MVAHEAQANDVLRRPHRRPLGTNKHAVSPRRKNPRRTQGPRTHVSRYPGFLQESRAPEVSLLHRHGTGRRGAPRSSKHRVFVATARTDPRGSIPTRSFLSTSLAPMQRGRRGFRIAWSPISTRPGWGPRARSTRSESATRLRRSMASGRLHLTCTMGRSRPCMPCSRHRAGPPGLPVRHRPTSHITIRLMSAGNTRKSAPTN